jgi:hypothetical protein
MHYLVYIRYLWSDPNFCLCINGKIWSMFLKYVGKMDLILILSKFSHQIGLKPKCYVFIQQFDRSYRSGRVNGKRPKSKQCF